MNQIANERVARNFFKNLGSTSANLTGLGSYTSSAFCVEEYQNISGICLADQDGTLYVEFSHNGINFYGSESTSYSANDMLASAQNTQG